MEHKKANEMQKKNYKVMSQMTESKGKRANQRAKKLT